MPSSGQRRKETGPLTASASWLWASMSRAKHSMSARWAWNSGRWCCRHQRANWRRSLGVRFAGQARVTGQQAVPPAESSCPGDPRPSVVLCARERVVAAKDGDIGKRPRGARTSLLMPHRDACRCRAGGRDEIRPPHPSQRGGRRRRRRSGPCRASQPPDNGGQGIRTAALMIAR